MFVQHPDVLLAQYHYRQQELIAEADRQHLLGAFRRRRREGVAAAAAKPAARGRPDGTLAACGPRAAAPAR